MTLNMNKRVLDSLPDKKWYEYAYHKYFNDGVVYENWKPHETWNYPERDILRFKHLITDQLEHITDKHVLDLACHIGYISLFCLYNCAKTVVGTNVRDKELEIANEICKLAGYKNYKFVNSDINNLVELKSLCDNVDTVMMAGVFYHVNNHIDILKTIYRSNAKSLIIESEVHLKEPEIPSIIFRKEDSSVSENGWDESKDFVFVGTPNQKYLEIAMDYVGYKIKYNKLISYLNPAGKVKNRLIIVGSKI